MVVSGSNQVLDKTFSCMGCRQTIKLQRKDDDSGWNKYNLDGSAHIHEQQKRKAKSSVAQEQEQQQQQEEQEQPQPTTTTTTTAKEIASIKAQLLVLVTRLDQLEKREGKEPTRR